MMPTIEQAFLPENPRTEYDTISRGVHVTVFPPLFPSTDKEKISSFCPIAQLSPCIGIDQRLVRSRFSWHKSLILLNGYSK